MGKWYVTVMAMETIEIEANSQEEAEMKAIDSFDAGAIDPEVHDSWQED